MEVNKGMSLALQGKSVWLILNIVRSEDSGHSCPLGSPGYWDPIDTYQTWTLQFSCFPQGPGPGPSNIEIV